MLEKIKAMLETVSLFYKEKVLPVCRRFMIIVLFLFASVISGYVAATIIGMNLPKTYTVEHLKTYNFPIETVWKELSTVQTYNEWKRDVNSVEYISAPGQTPVEYMEYYKMKPSIRYQLVQRIDEANRKVWETKIAGSSTKIKSQWFYQLRPYKRTTIMTMKQSIEIESAFERFAAHYIDKFIAESDGFLFALDRRLNLVTVGQDN